jgi:UDP-3-O-[3-hydroxymyristoyl] N-acetylglucosamine deacetylase
VKRLGHRQQRTIQQPVEVTGVGYLTGADVRLRFVPAPADAGVVFVRTDLGPRARVPATADRVTGTNRRTTLGHAPLCVGLVEHVLAALAGLRIDNCTVELDAPEPPGLDGSARGFVEALTRAGVAMQHARRDIWTVERAVLLTHGGATLALHPLESNKLKVSYLLDYGPRTPLGRQTHTEVITPESFRAAIADSRTFLLEEEAFQLRAQGIGSRTGVGDLLVFGGRGLIGNRLRYANEPARHKILDVLGDLALLGHDLRGHLVAYRSGHPLNVELVRVLAGKMGECCTPLRKAA